MPFHPRAPRPLNANPDADARSPLDRADTNAAVLDIQAIAQQVEPVVGERDAHRHRQIARTAADLVRRQHGRIRPRFASFHRAGTPATHHLDAIERVERANQHGSRRPVRFGDDVHEAVDAVVQIDVRVARDAVQRFVAPRGPGCCMTGRIGFADVGLDLDDDAARAHAALVVDEHEAEEIARDVERGTVVESAGQLHTRPTRPIRPTRPSAPTRPTWPTRPNLAYLPAAYACERPSANTGRR